MHYYKDNFLPEELFNTLSKEAMIQYRPRDGWYELDAVEYGRGLSGENYELDAPSRIVGENYPEKDNFCMSAVQMKSKSLPEVVHSIKKYMSEELKFINPEARMVWFQYHSNKSKVIPHTDNTLAGKPIEQAFTSLLYLHDTWEDEWAGEVCFIDGDSILPKPNRLVIYRRDEEHWVNKIMHNQDNYPRTLLFTGWATDNDIQ